MEISVLVPEIFKFEKCVKYANEMTDDVILNPIYLGQFVTQTIETW